MQGTFDQQMASQQTLNLDGDFRICGEQIMWARVLASAIEDYIFELEAMKQYKHRNHIWELQKIRRFIASEYCSYICDFVGLAPSQLLKRLSNLDKEFGLELAS